MWTSLCLAILATGAVFAQPPTDCSELGFPGGSQPFSGSDLPLCRRDEDQCCSENYLKRVQNGVQRSLERALREEFRDVIDDYQDEIDNLIEYVSDYIPTSLLRNLPFFSSLPDNPIISRILRSLIDNLEIGEDDDFDVGDFLEDLFDTVFRAIARLFGRNNDIVECIVDVVESLVDQDAVRRLNFRLQQVRRAITALMRIGRFLNREHSSLSDARILQECVELFVNLSFCDHCVQKTPPLCFSTCNALVRGCYSPFYTALNPQYSQLWVEVQRIINILNDTVGDVLSDEIELLDSSALAREVEEQCGVSMSDDNSRRKREYSVEFEDDRSPRMTGESSRSSSSSSSRSSSSTNDTASGSGEEDTSRSRGRSGTSRGRSRSSTNDTASRSGEEDTSRSRGRSGTSRGRSRSTTGDTTGDSASSRIVLDDFDDTVEFIPVALVDDLFQLNGAFEYGERGLQFCLDALVDDRDDTGSCIPLELLDDDERYCKDRDICTSKCYCTNGRNFTRDNETGDEFYENGVEGQDYNPVLPIGTDALTEEANRIAAELGTPVSDFLASDEFTSVDPETLELDPDEGDDDERASSKGLGVSLAVLLISFITRALL